MIQCLLSVDGQDPRQATGGDGPLLGRRLSVTRGDRRGRRRPANALERSVCTLDECVGSLFHQAAHSVHRLVRVAGPPWGSAIEDARQECRDHGGSDNDEPEVDLLKQVGTVWQRLSGNLVSHHCCGWLLTRRTESGAQAGHGSGHIPVACRGARQTAAS